METQTIVAKIPSNLMKLVEDQKYLGDEDLDTFMSKAVAEHIDRALNKMTHKKCREIEHKYGLDIEELQ